MRTLLLPLSARFIVYTAVLAITVILLFKFYVFPSVYVAISFLLFAGLAAIWPAPGLVDTRLSESRLHFELHGTYTNLLSG